MYVPYIVLWIVYVQTPTDLATIRERARDLQNWSVDIIIKSAKEKEDANLGKPKEKVFQELALLVPCNVHMG
jgi:hypothetical protein